MSRRPKPELAGGEDEIVAGVAGGCPGYFAALAAAVEPPSSTSCAPPDESSVTDSSTRPMSENSTPPLLHAGVPCTFTVSGQVQPLARIAGVPAHQAPPTPGPWSCAMRSASPLRSSVDQYQPPAMVSVATMLSAASGRGRRGAGLGQCPGWRRRGRLLGALRSGRGRRRSGLGFGSCRMLLEVKEPGRPGGCPPRWTGSSRSGLSGRESGSRVVGAARRPDIDVAAERGAVALTLVGPVARPLEGDDAGAEREGLAHIVRHHHHGEVGLVPRSRFISTWISARMPGSSAPNGSSSSSTRGFMISAWRQGKALLHAARQLGAGTCPREPERPTSAMSPALHVSRRAGAPGRRDGRGSRRPPNSLPSSTLPSTVRCGNTE